MSIALPTSPTKFDVEYGDGEETFRFNGGEWERVPRWPVRRTTGPDPKIRLAYHHGSIKVHVAGDVIENLVVLGGVEVFAPNVTIRNCMILPGPRRALYPVEINDQPGLVMEDCFIDGGRIAEPRRYPIKSIVGGSIICRRTEITRCRTGPRCDDGTIIEDCFIHNNYWSATSHSAGVSCRGGDGMIVRRNRVHYPAPNSSSCTSMYSDVRPINAVWITDNLMSGGSHSVNIANKPLPRTNMHINDNVFDRDIWPNGGVHSPFSANDATGFEFLRNKFRDGTPIPDKSNPNPDGSPFI